MSTGNFARKPRRSATSTYVAAIAALLLSQPLLAQPAAQPSDGPRHGIDIYVSQDALQGLYVRDMGTDELGVIAIRAGVFYNEERDLIGIVDGLINVGEVDRQRRLVLKVGPRAYGAFLAVEDQDVAALGFGGEARYHFGRQYNSAVMLTAYYAPDILTFGTADNIVDAAVSFELKLRPGTDIYVGYRIFELDMNVDSNRRVDDNLHVGFRRNF